MIDKVIRFNKRQFLSLCFATITTPYLALSAKCETSKAEHLPVTSHHQVSFTKYSGSNVEFSYPRNWKTKESKDKETIVKLAGNITDGISAELTVGLNPSKEIDAELLKSVATVYLKKLDNFKVLQEKKVKFGQSRRIEGLLQDVTFTMNGVDVFERIIFFDGPDGTYSCTFLTTSNLVKSAAPSFNRILLSFKFSNSKNIATTNTKKKETEYIKAKHAPISFSYPNGWKLEETSGEKSLEINGKDKAGRPATIAIYKGPMHPYTNLAQVAQALEREHLSAKSKYRRLNSQNKTFGSMSNIHGIVQECKFETDGVSYNQLVAYFNDSTHAYVVSMASPNWKLSEMRRTFHKVLASMKLKH